MASWPILSVTTFLPLVGLLFILALRGEDESVKRNTRWIALWTTIVTFAVSLVLLQRFDASSAEFQFVEKVAWLGGYGAYHMGVDGISLPFVILTTALMPLCIVASWLSIQTRVKEYMIAFLALEVLMVGTFSLIKYIGTISTRPPIKTATSARPVSSIGRPSSQRCFQGSWLPVISTCLFNAGACTSTSGTNVPARAVRHKL